jgi:engulfment and cell motility protein 1
MSSLTIEDLTSTILDFQANMVRLCYRQKTTLVEPEAERTQANTLDYVWKAAKLSEGVDSEGNVMRWRTLGFESEDLGREFGGVGVLGVQCFVSHTLVVECTSEGG